MSKRSPRVAPSAARRPGKSLKSGHARLSPMRLVCVVVVALALMGLVVLGYAGSAQPWFLQKVLGLVAATLAAAVVLLATQVKTVPLEIQLQLFREQHADFGRKLREERRDRGKVRLPLVGPIGVPRLVAASASLVVLAWWWSPISPMRVVAPVPPDLVGLLCDAVAAPVLVMPDGELPLPAPPVVPAEAARLARRIPSDADVLHQVQRAIAENRYDDARRMLDVLAASPQPGDPQAIGLLRALADAYDLRFPAAAEQLARLAADSPDIPLFRCQEAAMWLLAGQFGKADAALEAVSGASPQSEPRLQTPLIPYLRGTLAVCRGKADRAAMDLLQHSLQNWLLTLGDDDPLVGAAVNNQAVWYLQQARGLEALALADRARSVWQTAGDRRLPVALVNLAMIEERLAHFDQARQLCDQACQRCSESVVPGHPLAVFGNLARARHLLGRGERGTAEEPALVGLAQLEDCLGEKSSAVLPALRAVGWLYEQQASPDEALTLRLRTLSLGEEVLGADHPFGIVAMNDLGDLYLARQGGGDVEARLRQAISRGEKILGAEHPTLGRSHAVLGRWLAAEGKTAAARSELRTALAAAERAWGKEHPDYLLTLAEWSALDAPSDPAALAEYEQTLESVRPLLGAEHPKVAQMEVTLAGFHRAQGHSELAAPLLERALATQRRALAAADPALADTMDQLAAALRPTAPDRAAALSREAAALRTP